MNIKENKMSEFWKKLDNFWYHYKWRTIIISFFVIIAIICTVQMFQKKNYDYYIMYVGDENITKDRQQEIVDSFKKIGIDTDKNNEVAINFSQTVYDPQKAEYYANGVNASAENYLSGMTHLPYYIYIMSENVYEKYKDSGRFVKLNEVFGDTLPGEAYDDYALYLSKTSFAKNNKGLNSFSSDTVICLKVVPYIADKSGLQAEQTSFTNHMIMLRDIVKYGE